MIDSPGTVFVETREYRRFREFCDACRSYRYIGLCHGPPGVGKTLSARHYADWDRVESVDLYGSLGPARLEDAPGNGCVFRTVKVVNSPGQIDGDVGRWRIHLREILLQAIRREEEPCVATARRVLGRRQEGYLVEGDWFGGEATGIHEAEAVLSAAALRRAERSRAIADPTELLLIDEADRLEMAGLEQLRDIFDRGGVGLVLIGMPGLERRLARYAQLYSRIGFVHEFRPLAVTELRTLLASWRPPGAMLPEDLVADAEAEAAIIRITGGNFRLQDRLLTQVARILALNGLTTMTREAVEAAREVLVIGAA